MSRLKILKNWGVGPLKEKDRRAEGEKDRRTEAGEPEHARVPEGTVADFVVGIQGNPSCPNEFYGPWDPFGHATLPQSHLI